MSMAGVVRPMRTRAGGSDLSASVRLVLTPLLCLVVAVLFAAHHTMAALAIAGLPLGLAMFNRTRLVYVALLLPMLSATLLFGRAFVGISVGPLYVLDATLALVLLLALPQIVRAAASAPYVTSLVVLLMLGTGFEVLSDGITRITLRQSVIGMYAVWAIVGIAVARFGLLERFARIVFWSSAGATVVFALTLVHALNIQTIQVAFSLYIGYGLLFALFLPRAIRRTRWVNLLIAFEIGVLGLGFVRSVWVALPAAIAVTMACAGAGRRVRRQLVRFAMVLAAVVVVAAVFSPRTVHALSREADSVIAYKQGNSSSDANAKWRLNNWNYAFTQIKKHPIAGIGFGGAEVPLSVCAKGCAHQTGDPTIVPGSDLHNSIIALALRFGIPMFLIFLAFEAAVFARARRLGRANPYASWAFACHLLTGFTALTAVVLEGPYMGVFFWFFAGLTVGAAQLSSAEPTVEAAP